MQELTRHIRDSINIEQHWASLTRREREVLALVAQGKSNREIAQKLSITDKTAGHHVGHILRKLEVSSRTQAALWAIWTGTAEMG